jgi:RNA polymerase sigma factor (sigma-70 family)
MSASRVGVLLQHVHRLLGNRRDAGSDGQLLDRFVRQRDEQAFSVLMSRYGPLVWGACRRVVVHEQDAEDVFQATFLLLARQATTIRKRASVGSWLFGVAHRLALRARADAARRHRHEQHAVLPAAPDPSADMTWRELRTVLDEELARLPEKYRAPLLLCYFDGLTQEETASQLGWSKWSVKDRLMRGRNRLRGRLARRGLTLSAALTGPLLASETSAATVPAALVGATVRAAVPFGAYQAVAGAVPARVLALVEGGLKTMLLSRLLATFGLLAVLVAAGGTGLLLGQASPKTVPEVAAPVGEAEKSQVDRWGDPLPPGAVLRLGTVRFRPGGYGASLGFLPDCKTLVSAANRGHLIQLWEARTGKLLREISTGTLSVRGIALSPDGRCVAVGRFLPQERNRPTLGAVGIWDIASGKEVRTLQRIGRDGELGALVFTPDSELLLSLGDSRVLRVEEVATGLEILRHPFPRDTRGNLTLSPDGSTLAISSGPNTQKLYVWKWQGGEQPRELNVPDRVGRALAFSPDGKRLAEGRDRGRSVRVWDLANGRLVHELEAAGTESPLYYDSVVFSPDNKTLFASGRHGHGIRAVDLWDATTGRYLRRLNQSATGLAVSPDSRLLAGGGAALCVWDLTTGKELSANDEAHQSTVWRIAAAGNHVVTAGDDRTIRIWDPTTGRQHRTIRHGAWVPAVALSPDGTRLASSSLDDTVCLWDVATGRKIYQLSGHGQVGGYRAVGFTPDGKHFLSWGDDLYLREWDTVTGKAVREYALRPTGLNVPDEDDAVGEALFSMTGREGPGTCTPDGKTFVLSVGDQFHVFDVATGKDLRQIASEGSSTICLTISPDGKLLLASVRDKQLQGKPRDDQVRHSRSADLVGLWELASGKWLQQILLPEGGAGPVAFSADGTRFATATDRPAASIQLWEVATGREIGTVQGFRGPVRALAFSADGKRLISGMDDTTALVWDLAGLR